jgi:16S rRNA G1207 methylase RsmC
VSVWHVGLPEAPTAEDRVVAFNAAELAAARAAGAASALGFHEAVTAAHLDAGRAVEVHLPTYRGLAFVPLLAWLAARLAGDEAAVSWYAAKQQGPDSIQRLLEAAGWRLERDRRGRLVRLRGRPPAAPERPAPRRFSTPLGGRHVELAADYGVFSPERIDDGTALLLDVGLRRAPVDRVADVGVGYGPLAIGLVLAGVARAAVATEVDCVALWLAGENARACGVPLGLTCSPDPAAIDPTPLTVSNVPTHIDRHETERFMAGLAGRAREGCLLAVVHASLEARYTRHLESHGLRVGRHPGPAHVVLEARSATGAAAPPGAPRSSRPSGAGWRAAPPG